MTSKMPTTSFLKSAPSSLCWLIWSSLFRRVLSSSVDMLATILQSRERCQKHSLFSRVYEGLINMQDTEKHHHIPLRSLEDSSPHPLTSPSTSKLLPLNLFKFLFASFAWPMSANHFGLSTTPINPINIANPNAPPAPRMTLHSWPLLKKYPNSCAVKIPKLIIICVKDPNRPFSPFGAVSEMNMGTTTTAIPAPIPEMHRPSARTGIDGAVADRREPSM